LSLARAILKAESRLSDLSLVEQLPCPDGFVTHSNDPLRHAHEQINFWMVEMEEAASKSPHHPLYLDAKDLKKRFGSAQLGELLQAAVIRAQWRNDQIIYRILLALAAIPIPLSDEQLNPLVEASIGRAQCTWPREAVVERIENEFHRRPLNAEAWSMLHELHSGMAGDSSIEGQTLRRKLAVLLWHDPYEALDPKKCWSEGIRRDLRAMPEDHRKLWNSVFAAIPVSDNTEPPNKWKRAADSHIAEVGAGPFRQQLLEWLAKFLEREPVRLSMVGSHILKALLWYCRILRDPEVDSAAFALLHTKWRNKDFVFRPLTVLAGNIAMLPVEQAWPLLLHILGVLGDKASARLEKIVKQVGARQGLSEEELRCFGLLKSKPGSQPEDVGKILRVLEKMNWGAAAANDAESRFRYDGDYIEIVGQRDRYRGHVPSCTVRRLRDGALVELDYDRIPDYWRLMARPDQTDFQKFAMLLFMLALDQRNDFFVFQSESSEQ
jgi:hypothetical protein